MDESLIQQLSQSIGDAVGNSIKSSNDDIGKKLDSLQNTLIKGFATTATSNLRNTRHSNKQNQSLKKLLTSILNQISVALPGGTRAFGLGRLIRTITTGSDAISKFVLGLSSAVAIIGATVDVLYHVAQQLGGVDLAKAAFEAFQSAGVSLRYLFTGEIVNPLRTLQIQGTFGREFGGLIGTTDAAELQLITQRLGISVSELIQLQRALQATGMDVEDTVNEFRKVGILGRIASTELVKNADAIARAGNQFNRFIRDGVVQAKELGLEFNSIEKTLSKFSSDFEGTITQFAQLRAVIPGFGVNFGELLGTALFGTTTEYTELIRQGLLGAGITTTAGMSRVVASQLEAATGFSTAQINRILKGEPVEFDQELDLDIERNYYLKLIQGTLVAGFSVLALTAIKKTPSVAGLLPRLGRITTGSILGTFGVMGANTLGSAISNMGFDTTGKLTGILGSVGMGGFSGFTVGGIPGGIIGALLGGLAGFGFQGGFNDFIFRPGQPAIAFNPNDTLIGVKDTNNITSNRVLENKVDQLIMTMNEQLRIFKNGMFVEMRDLDRAIIRQQESTIRNY